MNSLTPAPIHRRLRRGVRPTVLLVTLLSLLAVLVAPRPAAAASAGKISGSNESAFLDLVNEERTDRGLRPLDMAFGPRQVARDWSETMAAEDTLRHRPDLAAPFVGRWTRLGENVGVGWSVDSLHNAFMNSSGHRANVLHPDYRWVGVGAVTMDSGKVWVTFNFGAGESRVADKYLPTEDTSTGETSRTHAEPASTNSGAETVGDFLDVFVDDTFAEDVVWLVESAITEGCTAAGDRFCPDQRVTRGQMAAFLVRALDLPDADRTFTDVPRSHPLADEIAAVAAAGITEGCTADGDSYCPDQRVSRAQLAAFLVRALDLPDADRTFTDVPRSHPLADEIAALAAAGVTQGCDTARFCPDDRVPRDQMAAFLHRALG